jgi:hypothetical protein
MSLQKAPEVVDLVAPEAAEVEAVEEVVEAAKADAPR